MIKRPAGGYSIIRLVVQSSLMCIPLIPSHSLFFVPLSHDFPVSKESNRLENVLESVRSVFFFFLYFFYSCLYRQYWNNWAALTSGSTNLLGQYSRHPGNPPSPSTHNFDIETFLILHHVTSFII